VQENADQNKRRGPRLYHGLIRGHRDDSQSRLTLNRRGGIIGERVVKYSLTPAPTSVTHPMTSKVMVEVRDPMVFL